MITPFGASRSAIPAVKSLRSGICASTLLPMMRSARCPSDRRRCARRQAKEFDERRNILLARSFSDIGGRLDAGHWNTQRQEVLKQISIVARYLEYLTLRT